MAKKSKSVDNTIKIDSQEATTLETKSASPERKYFMPAWMQSVSAEHIDGAIMKAQKPVNLKEKESKQNG